MRGYFSSKKKSHGQKKNKIDGHVPFSLCDALVVGNSDQVNFNIRPRLFVVVQTSFTGGMIARHMLNKHVSLLFV